MKFIELAVSYLDLNGKIKSLSKPFAYRYISSKPGKIIKKIPVKNAKVDGNREIENDNLLILALIFFELSCVSGEESTMQSQP